MRTLFIFIACILLMTSCVSKKKYLDLGYELDNITNDLRSSKYDLSECNKQKSQLESQLESEKARNSSLVENKQTIDQSNKDQMEDLKRQIEDLKKQREQQYTQVGDLTVLSQSANENINQTIKQLEQKDKYIRYLFDAKDKADSLNLALAVNLKSVLKKGIDDEDIEVKVDKTVVYVNLSDKMLFNSGSFTLTARADEVLSKVAQIIKSKPELDLMVEGYTDNVPISSSCMTDNWDLSVKRSAQVVRKLQTQYNVNPDKLIAAGRGEYNRISENTTADGRAMNRRTRIILLPRLSQFYDLLKPQDLD